MCYDSLGPLAQELLRLIAFLHHDGIAIPIFQRAAVNIGSYDPLFQSNLPELELEHRALDNLRQFLRNFLDKNNNWDEPSFSKIIDEISSQSLIEYDHANQVYRILVLVQSLVRSTIPQEDVGLATECTRGLLSISGTLATDVDSFKFRVTLGVHVDKALSEKSCPIGSNNARSFALVYKNREEHEKAEKLQKQILDTSTKEFGPKSPETLKRATELTETYFARSGWQEAKSLITQVFEARKLVLVENDPDTLDNMTDLALVYLKLNQPKQATRLGELALDTMKQAHGDAHPMTISIMIRVAYIHSIRGSWDKARALGEQAVAARRQKLGDDDPDTLKAMANLAHDYQQLGLLDKSIELHEHVRNAGKYVFGSEHSITLAATRNLESIYKELKRWERLRELQEQEVDRLKGACGDKHRDTLKATENLIGTYLELGMREEAEELGLREFVTRKRIFGEKKPVTLDALEILVCIYYKLGPSKLQKMRELQMELLEARQSIHGNDDPRTLQTAIGLAQTCINLGLWEEAEELNICVGTFSQVFGEDEFWTERARVISDCILEYRAAPGCLDHLWYVSSLPDYQF
ncbi:unnamed protein product [Rhizoctonia solani]|uniref:Uncharacterized protein n=1 Tax=Rhizoctonia solani TaxID=456999 RepID=A0A8H2WCG5_9AGAM|nr:unnamed protein product [Rhizoctonia solani]